MTKQYTVINICAGMGTMSLAFEQAGFQVICNLVRDPKEISIISENLGWMQGIFMMLCLIICHMLILSLEVLRDFRIFQLPV